MGRLGPGEARATAQGSLTGKKCDEVVAECGCDSHVVKSNSVPGAGLEPARPLEQRILSPPRLPFRHPGRGLNATSLRKVAEMKLRLWRHQMNLRNPITSAAQVHATRTHLFLELEIDGVVGLGEVSPQPVTLNGDPSMQDVLDEL